MKLMFEGNTVVAPLDLVILQMARTAKTVEECEKYLNASLGPRFWVYRGGHHVAVHHETGQIHNGHRLALFTEY